MHYHAQIFSLRSRLWCSIVRLTPHFHTSFNTCPVTFFPCWDNVLNTQSQRRRKPYLAHSLYRFLSIVSWFQGQGGTAEEHHTGKASGQAKSTKQQGRSLPHLYIPGYPPFGWCPHTGMGLSIMHKWNYD